ncbi:hypothetical protein CARUB_v10027723mg, partial [Capsella rubella]
SYRLRLPEGSKIHDVFHVSLLRHTKDHDLKTVRSYHPFSMAARVRGGMRQVLVKWTADAEDEVTWEDAAKLLEAYPELELEDKLLVEEEIGCLRLIKVFSRHQ